MQILKQRLVNILLCLAAASACATVRVTVENSQGRAWIKYECTAGETVRAFALDVTVDRGAILSVSDYFRGESTASAHGYGIFPASFRDHITIGTNIDWNVSGYTPLAVVADRPADTLPGLNSSGVTLEFGALWNIAVPAAAPDPSGTLCSLQISEPAIVSISANQARGGVVSASPEQVIVPVFSPALVDPSVLITGIAVTNGILTITFKGGELETCPGLGTPWSGTGNRTGIYSEVIGTSNSKFFRVRN